MLSRRRRLDACRFARFVAGTAALAGLGLVGGCRSLSSEPAIAYVGDADLEHYVGRATSVATPDVATVADDSAVSFPPHTVTDRSRDEIRDITLTEAIHLSLSNSEVIRERGQFLSPTNPLLNNPEFATSIYDPAIQETNTQFGNRGVEGALSDFDVLFTTQMLWGREERIQNQQFGFGPGQELQQDTAQFRSRLEKPIATGGTVAFSHDVDYEFNNAQSRLFDSAYSGNVQAEFRHPLLAGSGLEFNRIAGPQSRNFGRNATFTNGVLIARINNDIEVAEFQRAARNLVREVEESYWNLFLAYRVYHAQVVARNSALETLRIVQTREGLAGSSAAELAQAKESYFDARSSVQEARGTLYRRELELRRITGLPVNDGTVLRPAEEPMVAKFSPDWYASLCEALTSRVELRRQKWQIKSLELQLAAAENVARPNLDFVSRYRVNGFGDKLLAGDDDDSQNTQQGLDDFYNTVLDNDQTGWDLGLELSMPVGLRSAKAQVRWYELRLAKARAALTTIEHEISHELAAAFQEVEQFYQIAETSLNRRAASEERVRAYEAGLEVGGIGSGESGGSSSVNIDQLLRSQAALAQSEVAYWQAIISYNQAIADVYLREGTLLERAGVSLAEGTWTPKAYEQAIREAWARSHAFRNPLLDADPDPFAREGDTLATAVPEPVVRISSEQSPADVAVPPSPRPVPEPQASTVSPAPRPVRPNAVPVAVPTADDFLPAPQTRSMTPARTYVPVTELAPKPPRPGAKRSGTEFLTPLPPTSAPHDDSSARLPTWYPDATRVQPAGR